MGGKFRCEGVLESVGLPPEAAGIERVRWRRLGGECGLHGCLEDCEVACERLATDLEHYGACSCLSLSGYAAAAAAVQHRH